MGRVARHPVREFRGAPIQLMDGDWYADDPHALWAWMREEAPVYYDEAGDVLVGGLPPEVAWRHLRTVTDEVMPRLGG